MAERLPQERDQLVEIELDGRPVAAHLGETVATALAAAGGLVLRRSSRLAELRGVYCNMGVCYECLVYLNGRAVRACMTPVAAGMQLSSWAPREADPE